MFISDLGKYICIKLLGGVLSFTGTNMLFVTASAVLSANYPLWFLKHVSWKLSMYLKKNSCGEPEQEAVCYSTEVHFCTILSLCLRYALP